MLTCSVVVAKSGARQGAEHAGTVNPILVEMFGILAAEKFAGNGLKTKRQRVECEGCIAGWCMRTRMSAAEEPKADGNAVLGCSTRAVLG